MIMLRTSYHGLLQLILVIFCLKSAIKQFLRLKMVGNLNAKHRLRKILVQLLTICMIPMKTISNFFVKSNVSCKSNKVINY